MYPLSLVVSPLLFSFSAVYDSLWPHELQHARLPCSSLSPGVCSNSCPLSWWWYPIILSPAAPSSPSPQSLPALGSFLMRQLFASGGQSTEASTSASSSEHSGLISFRIDWFDLLTVQRTLKSLIQHHNSKASILQHSTFFMVQLSHPYMTWKNHSFDYKDLCWQNVSFLICRVLVCYYFPSKEQASLNFMAAVTIHNNFGAQENKICHCFHFSYEY